MNKFLFYTGDWNKPGTVFGVENPHSNDGRNVSRTLRWPNPESGEFQDRHGPTTIGRKMGATLLVDKRTDNFRARTQPCLGQIHDPIQSTKGIDFAFGLGLKDSTGCGAGDIIHGRSEGNFMLGKDRQRGVLAAVRQHLKKANYHNFKTLQDAFEYYDKNNDKFIDANELRKVAFDFNLPIDDDTLSALMVMSSQGTGKINYTQFINFLNWKDKMPDCPTHDSETDKIIQQIDSSFSHRTSASMINSTVGGLPTENWPAFGVPTVRSDIPAPCIRRVSDRTNYGDELGAYGLLSPSIFTDHGVFESDFFEPRDFSSIKRLFTAIGVEMSDEGWESAWKEALRIQQEKVNRNDQPCDKASVECFRLVLDSVTQTVKDAADVAT